MSKPIPSSIASRVARLAAARQALDAARFAAAMKAWNALSLDHQLRLVREVVVTRAGELKHAYRNVESIGYGFRTKRDRRGRATFRRRSLVVTFLVKRKWPKRRSNATNATGRGGEIPRHLLAYTGADGGRVLCAVPTDVESSLSVRPRRAAAEFVRAITPAGIARGTLACAMKVEGADALYALSADHLLEVTEAIYPGPAGRVEIAAVGAAKAVGVTSDFRGVVARAPAESFDAALMRVTDLAQLAAILPPCRPSLALSDGDELPDQAPIVSVWTTRGESQVRWNRVWHGLESRRDYRVATGHISVIHRTLIEIDARSFKGDSGSAVTSTDGSTLIGIVIAIGSAVDDATAQVRHVTFVLPAWDLVRGELYTHGTPPDGVVQPAGRWDAPAGNP